MSPARQVLYHPSHWEAQSVSHLILILCCASPPCLTVDCLRAASASYCGALRADLAALMGHGDVQFLFHYSVLPSVQ